MTRIAYAVIGANWGDEGKGLATDGLAHRLISDGHTVTVVRSNGGAQAGHGVERPDGMRHVFHHVGSGTLAGAATHLSRFFVAHPMLLGRELAELAAKGFPAERITIDPRARVTTPWDMAINQLLEEGRGGSRHGSTGFGFGETIERSERGYELSAADIRDPVQAVRILQKIRDEWVPARLSELGLPSDGGRLSGLFSGDSALGAFLSDLDRFNAVTTLRADADLGIDGDTVLFEGAQGLQLDMDYGPMPHVTRSNTGLVNMVAISAEAGIGQIRPLYMTRAYATRHGAGPLPHEAEESLPWVRVMDLTNVPNDWQGVIRQAPLDVDMLRDAIHHDLDRVADSGIRIEPRIGIGCLDQLVAAPRLWMGGQEVVVPAKGIAGAIAAHVGLEQGLVSMGPCRETLEWEDPAWLETGPEDQLAEISPAA